MAGMDMLAEDWTPDGLLDSDAGERVLAEMVDFLGQRKSALKASLDKGVTPTEFERGQKLLAAYDAAIQGLELAWKRRHRQ